MFVASVNIAVKAKGQRRRGVRPVGNMESGSRTSLRLWSIVMGASCQTTTVVAEPKSFRIELNLVDCFWSMLLKRRFFGRWPHTIPWRRGLVVER